MYKIRREIYNFTSDISFLNDVVVVLYPFHIQFVLLYGYKCTMVSSRKIMDINGY